MKFEGFCSMTNQKVKSDITSGLIFAAVLKRAALQEQFIQNHRLHIPGPSVEIQTDDYATSLVRCSCGDSLETTIVTTVETVVVKSKPMYGNRN